MPENHAPMAGEAFDRLIASLTEIRDEFVLSRQRFDDPLEVVEAYRYVGQMLSAMSELFWEGDPAHPRFCLIVNPARKLQGDNADAIYHFARIDGSHSYRIKGRIDTAAYTSFTVHGPAADGGMGGPLLGDINDRALRIDHDGGYELVLSAPRGAGSDGASNWMNLHPEAFSLVVRSYYQLPVSAQNDSSISVDIDIACLPESPPSEPLSDPVLARRMTEGVAFLRQVTLGQSIFGRTSGVPFVSEAPNELPTPFSFRDTGLPVPGAADIFYAACRWDLASDQALVMRGRIPDGPFSNVTLWNCHMQTLDYRTRRTSFNAEQIEYDNDGNYEIIVAHRDPGRPNWLDTEGHRQGSIFWRFLLPEEDPPRPECRVVTLDR